MSTCQILPSSIDATNHATMEKRTVLLFPGFGRLILALLAFAFVFLLKINPASGQGNCATMEWENPNPPDECPDDWQLQTDGHCNPVNDNTYIVRVYIHLVRKSNGTGAQSLTAVNQALNTMIRDFAPHGFLFSFIGLGHVDDDELYDFCNSEPNCDDVYAILHANRFCAKV